jgi:hypothetical protein
MARVFFVCTIKTFSTAPGPQCALLGLSCDIVVSIIRINLSATAQHWVGAVIAVAFWHVCVCLFVCACGGIHLVI